MVKTTLILFGFALGLLSTQGTATTYYLDSSSGNDWHTGNSAASALKSLHSASTMLFHPGDQILLKAGSVWQGETLDISTSDEEGAPVLISSYGTGNQPVLDGENRSSAPITLRNAHNVTISGLTIQHAGNLITVDGGSNITVKSCTLLNAGTFGVFSSSSNFNFSNNTYETTGSFRMAGDALRVEAAVSSLTVAGNTITFNTASRGASGIYVIDVDNADIYGNTITGGAEAIGLKGYTRSITGEKVHDNKIYYTDITEGDGESIEFTGRMHTSLRVSGSIYNNFIQGNSNTTNAIAPFQATNVVAYNNTVKGPLRDAAFHWSSRSTGGVIHDNMIENGVPNPIVVLSGSTAKIYNNTVKR